MEITKKDNHLKITNVGEYLEEGLYRDIETFGATGKVMSGFPSTDAQTEMYPGLYILGAGSSLGKTTFAYQMCDQNAESGKPVIYFSFEQSTLEMVTKSIARIMARQDM